jgi:hypothetical protein
MSSNITKIIKAEDAPLGVPLWPIDFEALVPHRTLEQVEIVHSVRSLVGDYQAVTRPVAPFKIYSNDIPPVTVEQMRALFGGGLHLSFVHSTFVSGNHARVPARREEGAELVLQESAADRYLAHQALYQRVVKTSQGFLPWRCRQGSNWILPRAASRSRSRLTRRRRQRRGRTPSATP